MNHNLLRHVWSSGRLIRGDWHRTDEQGRELMSLYVALAGGDPSARPSSCPDELMPQWLAYLLPWIDVSGSEGRWPAHMGRIVRLSPSFSLWTPEQASALERRIKLICLQEAMRHTGNRRVLDVCYQTCAALESRDTERLLAVRSDSWHMWTDEFSAYQPADAWVVKAAWHVAQSDSWGGYGAAESAIGAVWIGRQEPVSAPRDAADRIIDAILDAFEAVAETK